MIRLVFLGGLLLKKKKNEAGAWLFLLVVRASHAKTVSFLVTLSLSDLIMMTTQ